MQLPDPEPIKRFIATNRNIILYSVLIAIVAFGYELFNFSMSMDEETTSFIPAAGRLFYIQIGRWGTYLLNLVLFPESLVPYVPFLIGILCLAMSSVLVTSILEGSQWAKMVFSTIFITSPFHAYYLTFNTAAPYFGVGIVCVVVSFLVGIKAIDNHSRKGFLIAMLLLAVAISMYQAVFAMFITLCSFYLLMQTLKTAQPDLCSLGKKSLFLLLLIIFSVALYKMIDYGAQYILKVLVNPKNSAYLEQFEGWGKAPVKSVIIDIYLNFRRFIAGTVIPGGQWISIATLLVIVPALIIHLALEKSGILRKITSGVLVILLLISPYSLLFILGAKLPIRTMMAIPLGIGLIWWLAYQRTGRWGKTILLILVFYGMIDNTTLITRLFYSTYNSWQADRDMANRIYERICLLDTSNINKPITVAFIGECKFPGNAMYLKSEVFGASYFERTKKNPNRITYFFKSLRINNLFIISNNKYLESLRMKVRSLPSWPQKGSVCQIDSVIVVKISDD
jgi:hypothetical protein